MAHSRAVVATRQSIEQKKLTLPADPRQFVLLPAIARKRYKSLLETYELLKYENRLTRYNKFMDSDKRELGVIASGIAFNYLDENLKAAETQLPVLHITTYPFAKDLLEDITSRCKEVLVLEEGAPVIEDGLRGLLDNGIKVLGRLDGTVPRDGELNPTIVARALGLPAPEGQDVPQVVKMRPPSFCAGCGHSDIFTALNEAIKPYGDGHVFSDIGCYTLAALPPYNSINSCVDMGASVTMAVGAADAGLFPSVAVIGDSTFTHSGMTGLLDAVIKNSNVTIIISDNSTTGMTGGQKSHATGRLEMICSGLGVSNEHIRVVTPLRKNHEINVSVLTEEFRYNGVSVVIARRECIQTASKRKKSENTRPETNKTANNEE